MSNPAKEFGKIYDKHVEKIYRFVYLKVNSIETAQDLTSEVFLRGWESFKKKGKEIDNMSAFLYQIARNLVTDHYRTKAQAILVSTDSAPTIPDIGTSLEEMAMIHSDVDRIKAVLANIRDEYREVIVWYYLDEFSVPEIAKILNKSEEAVRVLIHRALKALKAELGEV
ncbi:MAG: RNA polymerase sigma factor [Candidatus Paceibacterota bacterium]|jgi:RNA polymerase sigma-70 factor (ECF subfamily)